LNVIDGKLVNPEPLQDDPIEEQKNSFKKATARMEKKEKPERSVS